MRPESVRATAAESARELPGDELIERVCYQGTHAVSIAAPPESVWPWLAQIGADRAGWYSYDWLDNGRRPSAEHIIEIFQHLQPGDVVPALPGATDAFIALEVVRNQHLVLGVPMPDGSQRATFALVLHPQGSGTRLIARARLGVFVIAVPRVGRVEVPGVVAAAVAPPVHFVMQRKQLLGVRRRAESMAPEARVG